MAISLRRSSQFMGQFRQKFSHLGLSNAELNAISRRIKHVSRASRSEDILTAGGSQTHCTVMINGIACLYERFADGSRQIFGFQHAGDFCDLKRHILPDANSELAVGAITDCSIGIIYQSDLEELIGEYPNMGEALWRSAMLEASVFRKTLLNNGRQTALQRVAHLLCEQLARQGMVGIEDANISLNQIDIADASGLSVVHVNRTFKELLRLNLLMKEGRIMKVVDRSRLAKLAAFDGNYLNMPHLLADWRIEIDGTPRPSDENQDGSTIYCGPS